MPKRIPIFNVDEVVEDVAPSPVKSADIAPERPERPEQLSSLSNEEILEKVTNLLSNFSRGELLYAASYLLRVKGAQSINNQPQRGIERQTLSSLFEESKNKAQSQAQAVKKNEGVTETQLRKGKISRPETKKDGAKFSASAKSKLKARKGSKTKKGRKPQSKTMADRAKKAVSAEGKSKRSTIPVGGARYTRWKNHYEQLVAYKAAKGDCNVPRQYEANPSLGDWVRRQRREQLYGLLSKERYSKLDEMGFQWSQKPMQSVGKSIDEMWEDQYQKLVAFKQQNGHVNVSSKENKPLCSWIQKQRVFHKKNKLRKDKVEKLENLGMEWGSSYKRIAETLGLSSEEKWELRYNQLAAYKKLYGHLNVSRSDKEHRHLAYWVRAQRRYLSVGNWKKIYDERYLMEKRDRLNLLGFCWAVGEAEP